MSERHRQKAERPVKHPSSCRASWTLHPGTDYHCSSCGIVAPKIRKPKNYVEQHQYADGAKNDHPGQVGICDYCDKM